MKITAQQFVANNKSKGSFVSVFRHLNSDLDRKVEKEGDIYCLLSISSEIDIPAERIAKFVWDGILDGYIYSLSKTTNDSIKDSIKEGVRKLRDLIRNEKNLEEKGVNLNFVIVVAKKEGLYIGNLGENDIYILKDSKVLNISEILQKNKAETAGIVLKQKDFLFASTKDAFSQIVPHLSTIAKRTETFETIKEFASNLEESQAAILLSSEEYKEEKEESKKIVEKDQRNFPPVKIQKPKPGVHKGKIKIPKIHTGEKTMRMLSQIGKVLRKVKQGISFVILKIGDLLEKLFAKIKERFLFTFGKKQWFKKIAFKISSIKISRKGYRTNGIRIDGYKTKDLRSKRIRIVIAVILVLVLLALGINFTINTKKERDIHNYAVKIFNEVDGLLVKAESAITTDKSSSETYLFQAEGKLKEITSKLNEADVSKKGELEKKAVDVGDVLYKRIGVSDGNGKVTNFLDSRLNFGEGSVPSDIDIYKDNSGNEYLLVTDKGLNATHVVSLYDKKSVKLSDPDGLIKEPLYVSAGNTGIFVFDNKEGVLKSAFDGKGGYGNVTLLSGLEQTSIRAEDISEFIVITDNDNVYLLSRGEKALLKSSYSDGYSYGLSFPYVTNDAFSGATDVSADLSLYFVTTEEPKLIRYNFNYYEQKQIEAPLQVGGFNGDYGNISKSFTELDLTYSLYLFDADGRRFLRFEKPMEGGSDSLHPNQILLEGQYLYRGTKGDMWSDVKDFVVDTNESAIYVLDGTVIWKVVL